MELQSAPINTIQGALSGRSASRGYAEGRCFVYGSEKTPPKESGYILVSKFTTPDMLPFMINASGIITEVGGELSHAAVTARELHIPCAVAVENVTQLLKDLENVTLDATRPTAMVLRNKISEIPELLRAQD